MRLAMSFPAVYYPLLLSLAIPVLYFVFACVCNIAFGVPILFILSALRTATMAISSALHTVLETLGSILRQGTAMCYDVSTALRTIVETMIFSLVALSLYCAN